MNTRKFLLTASFAMASVITISKVQATSFYIDPADGTFYSTLVYGPVPGGYTYGLSLSELVPTPGPTGNYYIETSWGVHPTAHDMAVQYSVGGTTYQTVDQRANVLGVTPGPLWSGFKGLSSGGIALTSGVSAITSTASGTGSHTRGIYRITELTGIIGNPADLVAAGGGINGFGTTTSSPGDGSYAYCLPTTTDDVAAFYIGALVPAGTYKIEMSWAVNLGHSASVNYYYDEAGDGFDNSTPALSGVNQQGMSDGRGFYDTAGVPLTWSGFVELGTFTVGFDSQIWLQKAAGDNNAYTMGALQFTAVSETPLEAWRFANFGDTRNIGIGADSEDPDGDGQNNLAEYTAGNNPKNGQDAFRVISTSRVEGSFAVTTSGKSGRKYVLEQSPTLVEGTWTSVTTLGPLASDAIIELTDPAPVGNTNFYRIRVEFP